jgi:3-oxoadipate enol-lactonase
MRVEDRGEGPPVLAIPGLGGGAHFFGGFARRLQADYRVLSVDLPGTGERADGASISSGTAEGASFSPRSVEGASFSMDSWVADLGTLVAARVEGPIVLLGHSLGTIVALKAWQAWPERIRGLIFVGGLPEVRPAIRARLSQRLDELTGAPNLLGWGPKVSPANFSPKTMCEQPEMVALFERQFETQRVEAYTRTCRILLDSTASALVPTVTVPSLAITGADDQYAPPDLVSAFVDRLPNHAQVVVVPDCGHLPFLERPEAFASAVKAFLRSC